MLKQIRLQQIVLSATLNLSGPSRYIRSYAKLDHHCHLPCRYPHRDGWLALASVEGRASVAAFLVLTIQIALVARGQIRLWRHQVSAVVAGKAVAYVVVDGRAPPKLRSRQPRSVVFTRARLCT